MVGTMLLTLTLKEMENGVNSRQWIEKIIAVESFIDQMKNTVFIKNTQYSVAEFKKRGIE